MCDKGLWKAYHFDVQRIADKYQKYIREQLWGFPSNQMPLRTPCWISLKEQIFTTSFNNVLSKKSSRENKI